MFIPLTEYGQDFKILNLFTPLPIYFQLDLNTNTKRVNSLIVMSRMVHNSSESYFVLSILHIVAFVIYVLNNCSLLCFILTLTCSPEHLEHPSWYDQSCSFFVVIAVQCNISKQYLIIIIKMRVIYIAPKNVKQTHRRSPCTSAKRMTSILRHVAEAFPPARQGTILNSHRVIGIATNTSMTAKLRLSDLAFGLMAVITLALSQLSYLVDCFHSPSTTYAWHSYYKHLLQISLIHNTSGRLFLFFA